MITDDDRHAMRRLYCRINNAAFMPASEEHNPGWLAVLEALAEHREEAERRAKLAASRDHLPEGPT